MYYQDVQKFGELSEIKIIFSVLLWINSLASII